MLSPSRTTLTRTLLGGMVLIALSSGAAFAQATFTPAPGTNPAPKPATAPAKTTTPPAKTTTAPAAKTTTPPAAAKDAAKDTAKDTAAPAGKDTAPAATTVAAATPDDPEESAWIKICGVDPQSKKQTCAMRTEMRSENGQFISSITIQEIPDQKKFGVGVMLPIGVFLPKGVGIIVDNKKAANAEYTMCLPVNPPMCIGEALVDATAVDALKKGKKLELSAFNNQRREIKIEMSLNGFGKTFDSPGLDPQKAMDRQNELNQALQKRAEERRQRLIDQQNKATPASTDGAAAAAPKN